MAVFTTQIPVLTSASLLVTGANSTQTVTLHNDGAAAVSLGNAAVTTANGLSLASGQYLVINLRQGEALYAIAGAVGNTVSLIVQV